MKNTVFGLFFGIILTAGLISISSAISKSEPSINEREMTASEIETKSKLKQMQEDLRVKRLDYQSLENKYEQLKGENEVTKESLGEYFHIVSNAINGEKDYKYEIIKDENKNIPNTTVVFAEEYKGLSENMDLQKLYLLRLVNQLNDVKSSRIEFWSSKEHAISYVSGDFEQDGSEGWTGMNSRFGLLIRDGNYQHLSYILSPHERDEINFGMYKREGTPKDEEIKATVDNIKQNVKGGLTKQQLIKLYGEVYEVVNDGGDLFESLNASDEYWSYSFHKTYYYSPKDPLYVVDTEGLRNRYVGANLFIGWKNDKVSFYSITYVLGMNNDVHFYALNSDGSIIEKIVKD